MTRATVLFLIVSIVTLTACGAEQATPMPDAAVDNPALPLDGGSDSPVPTVTHTAQIPVVATLTSTVPPKTPITIGTVSANGIENLATLVISPTGTLDAILNPDINANNPLKVNLSTTPVYILNLSASGYTVKVPDAKGNGYYYFVDNPNKPGRVKVAFSGAGTYSVQIYYEVTETATGTVSSATLTIPFQVSGSLDAPPSGNGGNGGNNPKPIETCPPGFSGTPPDCIKTQDT